MNTQNINNGGESVNNIPAWCKPFTEVYRKANGGRWHLYDIISATEDGVKVRTFVDYRDRIETMTLADIISDGEKIASGEYETETRKLTPKQTEAVAHAFDILPAGTVVYLEGFYNEYQRITGYDPEHHRYNFTSSTGIRAEFMGTYYAISKPDNKHTADELPTWCKPGTKFFWVDSEYLIKEISDGIVWIEQTSTKIAEGLSIDFFIQKTDREYITLLEAAIEITDATDRQLAYNARCKELGAEALAQMPYKVGDTVKSRYGETGRVVEMHPEITGDIDSPHLVYEYDGKPLVNVVILDTDGKRHCAHWSVYTLEPASEITEAEGVKVGDKVRHNKHEEVATVTAIREAFVNRADGYRYLYTLEFGQSVLSPFQVELNGGEFLREAFTLCNPSEIKAADIVKDKQEKPGHVNTSWATDYTPEDFQKLRSRYEIAYEDRDIVGRRFHTGEGLWTVDVFVSDYAGNDAHALIYLLTGEGEVRANVLSIDHLRQTLTEAKGWTRTA